ncbi:PREDICTED: nuclear receptor coactivator 3-like isoform X2 [Papilio xuthus]|uniref:Nuclear receptor coactivator 3-like isoform X2 n=1 Tax=Papilio xuthus TaxID=66420 RepID=A0AAJ6ZUL6_PAPXU|nr:PREDICTED: nuclear receptor coactivator 3-like isoform X2 [Papilio xuthus]
MDWPIVKKWPPVPQDKCYGSCEVHKDRPAPKPPDSDGAAQTEPFLSQSLRPDSVGPAQAQPYPDQSLISHSLPYPIYSQSAMEPTLPPDVPTLKGESPRDLRNKAEKQRRDKMNKAIKELSKIVPPVQAMTRKVDKTSVLRLTAHYLRSHQHVFGDSLHTPNQFGASSVEALMSILNGFILTTTYKGLVVVISPNVEQYLGYTELDLIGHNIINIIHEEDQQKMLGQLLPKSFLLGPNDEILFPEDPESKERVTEALRNERRYFNIRFKKNGQRSEKHKYLSCNIEGSFRKSDRADISNNRHTQMVRRLRARGRNWCSSGNDVVFIGVVRPYIETFVTESKLNSCLMEYRTRHSIDGEIINCDSRISVATGYMASEVRGVNAMNFMHRDDVRWVIVALREMYDHHRLSGESCYRLMTKCGSFVYMRTQGFLEVDKDTGSVTSFVCINKVVDREEGKLLNMAMKKKFMMLVNNTDETPPEDNDDEEVNDRQGLRVEDPQQLQKVILHLVTNLPSPCRTTPSNSPSEEERSPYRLSIIPPKKERIVNAIDKIYNEPSSSNMRQLENPAPDHRESHAQASGSFLPYQVPGYGINYPCGSSAYHPHSGAFYPDLIPIYQPPWHYGTYGSRYISENLPSQAIQTVQPGPSRPPPIPYYPIPYPYDPSRQYGYPTYVPEYCNIYQQYQPQAEVKRHYHTTETEVVPSKRQHVDRTATSTQSMYLQESRQESMTTTQEDLLSFLEDFTLPVHQSQVEESDVLDDFVNRNLHLNMPHDRAWEEQELGLILALLEENSPEVPIDPEFDLPEVDIVHEISSTMPLTSHEGAGSSDAQAGLQYETEEPNLDFLMNLTDVEETVHYLSRKVEIIKAIETLKK